MLLRTSNFLYKNQLYFWAKCFFYNSYCLLNDKNNAQKVLELGHSKKTFNYRVAHHLDLQVFICIFYKLIVCLCLYSLKIVSTLVLTKMFKIFLIFLKLSSNFYRKEIEQLVSTY